MERLYVPSHAYLLFLSPSLQVEGMKMVVSNSINLANCRSSFLSAMSQAVSITREQTSSHDNVAEMIGDLKVLLHYAVFGNRRFSRKWSFYKQTHLLVRKVYVVPLTIPYRLLCHWQLASCKLARCLMNSANEVVDHLSIEDTVIEEDLSDTYLGTIHACFNLGFEVSSCLMSISMWPVGFMSLHLLLW